MKGVREVTMKRYDILRKEIRQTMSITIAFLVVFAFVLVWHRHIAPMMTGYWSDPIPIPITLFVIVLGSAISFGSFFLSEENGAGTANFLLRLPVRRRQIVREKFFGHLGNLALLLCGCVIVAAFFPTEMFRMKIPVNSEDILIVVKSVLFCAVAYELYACLSLKLKNFINTFASAAICIVMIKLIGQILAQRFAPSNGIKYETLHILFYTSLSIVLFLYLVFLIRRKEVAT